MIFTPRIISRAATAAAFSIAVLCAQAQDGGVALHGSVQANVLFPEEDTAIETGSYDHKILFNTYADLGLVSRYVD
ncbi:MAG: hypothetical protein K2F63_02345, partial [Muribaculaceae bacterium]|nr:hypothetical protein [Muribaculaceae bacterium]